MKKKQNELTRVLSSVKLAVVLLAAIAATSLIGTLMPQAKANESIYGAWWFLSLLGMLGINLITCTLTRFRMQWSRVGTFATHLAVLLILSGALVDGIWGERGMMILGEGKSSDTFGEAKNKLPFSIRLEDFVVERYEPVLAVTVFRRGTHGSTQSFLLDKPSRHVLSGTNLELSIEEIKHDIVKETKLVPADEGGAGVLFSYGPSNDRIEGFVLEGSREDYQSGYGFLRVVLRVFSDGDTRDRELADIRRASGDGYIEISGRHGSAPARLDVLPGRQHRMNDGTAVKVLKYFPHFTIDDGEAQNMSDKPVNPAVQVEISRPGGDVPGKTWLFSKFPDFHKNHGQDIGVSLEYIRPASLDFANSISLYAVRDGDLKYAVVPDEGSVLKGTGASGTRISIGPKGMEFELIEVLRKAELRTDVTAAESGKGKTGARVRIFERGNSSGDSVWLIQDDAHSVTLDETGLSAVLASHPGGIKDFKSKLQVIEG